MDIPAELVIQEYKVRLANVMEQNIIQSMQIKLLEEQLQQLLEAPKE